MIKTKSIFFFVLTGKEKSIYIRKDGNIIIECFKFIKNNRPDDQYE